MGKWFFWLAAILCAGGVIAHEAIGAPMVLPPLSGTDLPPNIVWLHHFSWHVGSVTVIAMIAMFLMAAMRPHHGAMAVLATLMSFGMAGTAIALAVGGNPVIWDTPAPYVWSVIGIVGMIGILAGKGKPGANE